MTILDRIIETKRAEIERARRMRPLEQVIEAARGAPPPRDFLSGVTKLSAHGPQLIAEIKKKSPSAGLIRADFDPVEIARIYARHGAAAISVLTDETYFDGRLENVRQVKLAAALPVLRKEFILEEYQVYESRAAEADAVLLIVEAIGVDRVAMLAPLIVSLGMGCLVEVHSEGNLLALLDRMGPPVFRGGGIDRPSSPRQEQEAKSSESESGASFKADATSNNRTPYLLGINNRDLSVQRTDLSTTKRLAQYLPPGSAFVSESGIASRADVEFVNEAGACAILVGESILKHADMAAKIGEFRQS